MLPSRSTTERYVVSPPSLANWSPASASQDRPSPAPSGDRSARRALARTALLNIAATGTCGERRIGDVVAPCRRRRPSSPRSGDAARHRRYAEPAMPKRLDDVQHHQRGNACAVGRQLEDVPPAVARRNGFGPLRAELGQIGTRPSSSRAARGRRRAGARPRRDRTPRRLRPAIWRYAHARSTLRKTAPTAGGRPLGGNVLDALRIVAQERLLDVPLLGS